MKVCIAEKPSVAREIAEVLGATQRMNGYIEGNESGCIGAKRQCRVAAFGTDVSHSFRIAVPDRFEIKILT